MAVDQIEANYPGQVAAIEWHTNSGYPGYCADARTRWYTYPPPYYVGGNWYYATPWAWIDGKNRGYQYSGWDNWVQQRLAEPAELGVALAGNYTPGAGTGELTVELVNPTAEEVTANLYVVITEDSLHYSAPNGDQWHNHVLRGYLTGVNGTGVTIPALGADTFVQPFTIESNWIEDHCNLIALLQEPTQQPDSSRPVLQGGTIPLLTLTGAAEPPAPRPALEVSAGPNPVSSRAGFRCAVEPGTRYRLELFSPDGRLVRRFAGMSRTGTVELEWDRTGLDGDRLSRGVYAWRLSAGDGLAAGKLVVTD